MPRSKGAPTKVAKSRASGVKRKASVAADEYRTPAPPSELHVTPTTVATGTRLHRVHSDAFGGAEFNPGLKGNARFSPIRNAAGVAIPTIYAAGTMEGALMESVFHDVPHSAGFKQLDKAKPTALPR